MNGLQPPIKPLCKALFLPGDSWTSASPADFFAVEVDTHGMFNKDSPSYLKIPVSGLYSVIVNINHADASIESEWGLQASETPTWLAWDTSPYIARCYTGFGPYNGQYAETLVNLKANDYIWLVPRKSAQPTVITNYTTSQRRTSHLIIQYQQPPLPTRGANGTVYDYR